MPIPLLNLDDRTYADLFAEMRALIPRYAPAWTDYNDSDPGITLLQLLAWLTEGLIYRLDRVPEASEACFLELLGGVFQPAQPALVELEVRAAELSQNLTVPRGMVFMARSQGTGEVLGFETMNDLTLTPAQPSGKVKARQAVYVANEQLGVSTGRAYQVFPLARPFLAIDPTDIAPLLPAVRVDGEAWSYRANLLASTATAKHFTVQPRLNAIRFGGDRLGKIPPAGATIEASYPFTAGAKGNVTSETAFESKPIEGISLSVVATTTLTNGADPTSLDEARYQAISALKTRWRAITAEDFEALVLGEASLGLARARCLPERNLEPGVDDPEKPRPGHVSVIIVPQSKQEQPKPSPSKELLAAAWGLLDGRRLITCRHHVVGPGYSAVRAVIEAVRSAQVEDQTVRDLIAAKLQAFFHPLTGGPDGEGWPFGRDVYASEVYQVVEGIADVDHVESLVLRTPDGAGNWSDAGDRVAVPPNNLVYFTVENGDIQVRAGR